MRYLSLIIGLMLCYTSIAYAQDLTGVWTGYLDQSEAAAKIKGYKVYWDKGFWKKGKKTHGKIRKANGKMLKHWQE